MRWGCFLNLIEVITTDYNSQMCYQEDCLVVWRHLKQKEEEATITENSRYSYCNVTNVTITCWGKFQSVLNVLSVSGESKHVWSHLSTFSSCLITQLQAVLPFTLNVFTVGCFYRRGESTDPLAVLSDRHGSRFLLESQNIGAFWWTSPGSQQFKRTQSGSMISQNDLQKTEHILYDVKRSTWPYITVTYWILDCCQAT